MVCLRSSKLFSNVISESACSSMDFAIFSFVFSSSSCLAIWSSSPTFQPFSLALMVQVASMGAPFPLSFCKVGTLLNNSFVVIRESMFVNAKGCQCHICMAAESAKFTWQVSCILSVSFCALSAPRTSKMVRLSGSITSCKPELCSSLLCWSLVMSYSTYSCSHCFSASR